MSLCNYCKYRMDCRYVPALDSCNEDNEYYMFQPDEEGEYEV